MGLEIIGTGFGRTGTLSTYMALQELGYPCYHMFEVMNSKKNPGHLKLWNDVANNPDKTNINWDTIFENYTAAVDNPACTVWKSLYATYPDAKIILTLHPRGPEVWYDSTYETIYASEIMWQFKLMGYLLPSIKRMSNMTKKLVWDGLLRGTMKNKTLAVKRYKEHIEEVKAVIPADRLLIFKVTEGWKPLCDFLGKPIPDKAFPRVNERAEMSKKIQQLARGAYIAIAILVAIIIFFSFRLYHLIQG